MTGAVCLSLIVLGHPANLMAQQGPRTVTGIVTDADGEPLAGATVIVGSRAVGTTADAAGAFSLTASTGEIITFSYLGYESTNVVVDERSFIAVTLQPASTGIDEIVVTGYGSQRKRDITGSISSVKAEDLTTTVAAANPMQALQGKVAGVEIVQDAAPGGAPTVRVRGVGSFSNTDPCYVVDGLIMSSIEFLNPNDIQSIEVLKDASATAIYGSRGANGVIIITTLQGRKNQPVSVNVDANISFAKMEKYLPYATASQFLTLKNMQTMAENAALGVDDPLPYTADEIAAAGKGTDWQREITRMARTQNYNINIVGGGEKSTYGISAGYFKQEGVMKGSDYQRASIKITNTYDLARWATLGSNITFVYEQRHSEGSSLSSALRALPTAPVRYAEDQDDPLNPENFFGPVDEIGKSGNPVASLYYNSDNFSNYYKTIGNFFVDFQLVKGLSFRSSFTFDNSNSDYKAFYPRYQINTDQLRTNNQLSISQSRTFNWLNENILTYDFRKGDHQLNVVAGITLQDNRYQYQDQSVQEMPDAAWKNKNLWYTGLGQASTLTGSSSGTNYSYLSYLARANYTFAHKYLVTATIRVDGSSRFPEDGRYGTFPALGLGWTVSEEAFMKDLDWLNYFKLRTSYGIVGSDAGIPNNVQTVYTQTVTGVFGKNPESATTQTVIDASIDPGLHWEEARQFNVGFDASLLDQRLSLEMDYYVKTTKDILTYYTFPGVSSTHSRLSNIASARNRGFEFNVGWSDRAGEFGYHMNVVGTTLRNKVISVNTEVSPLENGVNRTLVGYPIGGFWGYEVLGIYQTQQQIDQTPHLSGAMPGDIWYADTDGNGEINSDDRIYMGSYLPKATLGFNFGLQWKGLDLTVDLYSSLGNKVYSLRRQTLGTPNYNVSWDDFKNAWTGPGTTNTYTRPLLNGSGTNNNASQYYLEDGSYFRIRNVVLGYRLPESVVSKMHLKALRVYVAANNLLTVSNVSGYSPEIGGGPNAGGREDYGTYPASRMFSVGINIGF